MEMVITTTNSKTYTITYKTGCWQFEDDIWESEELDEFLREFERRGGGGDRV